MLTSINTYMLIQVLQAIENRILGLVDNLLHTRVGKTLVSHLLFYARKVITLHWKKHAPASIPFWKCLLTNNLPLYKDTFVNRRCAAKYNKVWAKWLPDAAIIDIK